MIRRIFSILQMMETERCLNTAGRGEGKTYPPEQLIMSGFVLAVCQIVAEGHPSQPQALVCVV